MNELGFDFLCVSTECFTMSFYHDVLLRLLHAILAVTFFIQSCIWTAKKPLQFQYRKRTRDRLQSDARSLNKLPLHIGLLVLEDDISYTDVANIVVWCMTVGISYISLYDTQGDFKRNCTKINNEILKKQEEVLGNESTKCLFHLYRGGIEVHNKVNDCRIHVNLLSLEDGRQDIVRAAKYFCQQVACKRRKVNDLNPTVLENDLQGNDIFPDPDLIIKFGDVDSLLGFLPYQIRLSEILCSSSHHNMDYKVFISLLYRYAGCAQRYGK
ncbi:dehydrodolichyl diphosphate synthase complex subunit nus1-like [Saccoglossus kowalevskii]|uniref:ditrans,polycis-polyprenyl diphosphate synthase [(2E,6E)-farnesyldiphosphate specific] n=1 Tax=Saccoglossus kowalevskii TaxID=10224 RepID=A0ABM0GQW8_SACKO|nr:PREDICTED: nogo-B receptor-like [Saccoglossus kowalevskii]